MNFTFEDDASLLYLRSRFIGTKYKLLTDKIAKYVSYREEPFKLRAKSIQGNGSFIELTLIARSTESGDERVLGPLSEALVQPYSPDSVTFVVSIRYKD